MASAGGLPIAVGSKTGPELATVVIVGAGPAGIGVAAVLKQCGLKAVVLDRGKVGQTFLQWPKEMRFISPSFTGNFFGVPDLNAITPDSSPAFGLQTEHPTGELYARYLNDVVNHFKLDVREETEVLEIVDRGIGGEKPPAAAGGTAEGTAAPGSVFADAKLVKTSKGEFGAAFVVWAGGEFQYPRTIPNTIRVGHGSKWTQYADLPRGPKVVIGGSESGIDITHHLTGLGDKVTVLDSSAPWARRESDSSYGLSPYSFDRLAKIKASGLAEFVKERATSITETEVKTETKTIPLEHPAIDATGFDITQSLAGTLFEFKKGMPMISEHDESTKTKNVFMCGPHVAHGEAIFCFIYKYRQRYAVVVREMLKRLGQFDGPAKEVIETHAKKNFLLEDLSCCGDSCAC